MRPTALVLVAAGASSRMGGRDKLLEPVGGGALLTRQAKAALAAGLGPVAVTLAPDRPARLDALAGLKVTRLVVPEAAEGMSASLRVAALWAEGHDLMVIPADMPDLGAADFRALAAGFDGASPWRATAADGTPGHPVLFPAALLGAFATLAGDQGARAILSTHPPVLRPLPGRRALVDLDTPEDWAAWRAAQDQKGGARAPSGLRPFTP